MIRWEAWCYRCRERDSGETPSSQAAHESIEGFRRLHRSKCGATVAIGSQTGPAPNALLGVLTPRED